MPTPTAKIPPKRGRDTDQIKTVSKALELFNKFRRHPIIATILTGGAGGAGKLLEEQGVQLSWWVLPALFFLAFAADFLGAVLKELQEGKARDEDLVRAIEGILSELKDGRLVHTDHGERLAELEAWKEKTEREKKKPARVPSGPKLPSHRTKTEAVETPSIEPEPLNPS